MSNINIYNQDCMEAMKSMPDKAYELAIVDPPYGIGAPRLKWEASSGAKIRCRNPFSGSGKLKNRYLNKSSFDWDDCPPEEHYFKELRRISENQIIWGGNYFPLPPSRCVVCWDKCQPWTNFSQWEMAWTSFGSPASLFRYDVRGNGIENKIHPTQKPVALYQWLLKNYAKPGDKILDTHGGSMSIAIACHDLGFDLTLYEIDKDYFQAGKERLERHMAQSNLFMQPTKLIVNY